MWTSQQRHRDKLHITLEIPWLDLVPEGWLYRLVQCRGEEWWPQQRLLAKQISKVFWRVVCVCVCSDMCVHIYVSIRACKCVYICHMLVYCLHMCLSMSVNVCVCVCVCVGVRACVLACLLGAENVVPLACSLIMPCIAILHVLAW